MTKVVLYIPPDAEFDQLNKQLHEYCTAKNYEIVSIQGAGPDVEWAEVHAYARDHQLVIVVADASHVPADRVPRVEVADLAEPRPDLPDAPGPARRRRPRPV